MSDSAAANRKWEKGWKGGLPETPCGLGSKISETALQRAWIPKMIRKHKIKTIADIGAGDLNWIKEIKMPKTWTYQAFDLVPRHPEVTQFDLLKEIPPKVDLLLCMWVINHMEYDEALTAWNNLKASGSKYLMMTYRPIWQKEQPEEIGTEPIESLIIREEKQDQIRLIQLNG